MHCGPSASLASLTIALGHAWRCSHEQAKVGPVARRKGPIDVDATPQARRPGRADPRYTRRAGWPANAARMERAHPGAANRPAAADPGRRAACAGRDAPVPVADAHVPNRPTWECRACLQPWPCPPARDALLAEGDATALSVYMAAQMAEAAQDLPAALPGALFDRFLLWTKR